MPSTAHWRTISPLLHDSGPVTRTVSIPSGPSNRQTPKLWSRSRITMQSCFSRSATTGEVTQDGEGTQIMRVLGKNMAWILKLKEHGKVAVAEPEREAKTYTNLVR